MQTLMDKSSKGSNGLGESWHQTQPELLFSLFQPAGEAVSNARRSNQHPRCRAERLDRQTDGTNPPVSVQALELETETYRVVLNLTLGTLEVRG